MFDAPDIFFDGAFDELADFNGRSCRAIVEELSEPSDNGGLVRKAGRWAKVHVRASELTGPPKVHDLVTVAGTAWDVQQVTRQDCVWLMLCLADQRMGPR